MTEQMPPNPLGGVPLEYRTPPGNATLAVTSMVLGILGVVMGIVVIGVLLGIAGLILGIIALGKINRDPRAYGGKGFALTGIVTGALSLLAIPLLIGIVLWAHESANRSYCAANLRGIVESMVVYCNENNDCYPLVMPPKTPGTYHLATDGAGGNTGLGTYATTADALKAYYGSIAVDAGSIPANMWILVLNDQCVPKQFICKSDPVATNVSQLRTAAGTSYYVNFNGANPDYGYSYSTAYPWTGAMTPADWWRNTDYVLPIISDMAPADGSGGRPVVSTPGTGSSGISVNGPKAWNSPNHGRAGQEVGFGDGHVEWSTRPDIGLSNDNIFTTWNGSSNFNQGTPVTGGTVTGLGVAAPGAAPATSPPFDIVMVPVADVATGERR